MNLFRKFILGGEPALYMKHVLVPTTTFLLSARSKWTDASKSFDRNRVPEADAEKVNKAFDDWEPFHYDPNSPTHAMCRVINARAHLDIVKSMLKDERAHVESLYASKSIKIDKDIFLNGPHPSLIRWEKPGDGGVKLNVDGSMKNPKRYAWVLRDSQGEPFYLQGKQVPKEDMGEMITDSNVVEFYALCKAISEAVPLIDKKEYKYLIIHGDNENAIDDLKTGKATNSFNNSVVEEAVHILDRLEKDGKVVTVEYAPRHINVLADYICRNWVENGMFDGIKDLDAIKIIKEKDPDFLAIVNSDKEEVSVLWITNTYSRKNTARLKGLIAGEARSGS